MEGHGQARGYVLLFLRPRWKKVLILCKSEIWGNFRGKCSPCMEPLKEMIEKNGRVDKEKREGTRKSKV